MFNYFREQLYLRSVLAVAVNVLLSRYTLNRGAHSWSTMFVKIARKSRGRRDMQPTKSIILYAWD